MGIKSILIENFKIISSDEWNLSFQKDVFKEVDILIVKEPDGHIMGAVTSESPEKMIPAPILSIDQLYADQADWLESKIVLVTDHDGRIKGCIKREELVLFLYRHFKKEASYFQCILSSLPHEVSVIDESKKICFMNNQALKLHGVSLNEARGRNPEFFYQDCQLGQLLSKKEKEVVVKVTDDRKGIMIQTGVNQNDQLIGAVQIYWKAEELEKIAMNLDQYMNLSTDLRVIFDATYDVIYVSDGKGMTLRVSSACEKLWGLRAQDLIGKSVYKLEEMGVFKPSVTRLVLEKKERVQIIQTTKTGRRLMVIGTPIKDEKGNIVRVVNASRDITEESRLRTELEDMKLLMEGYRQQLSHIKEIDLERETLIFKSEQMGSVVTLARKVAEVDSTILIQGESGVGKEVIASFIHSKSNRKNKPFIKVNCGAIPENLLESELFGYEKGAFTGASKTGKPGLFELANEGTLFLDEIAEIQLTLQVKLLRVLQESEFTRIGGTKPVVVNVRIITATNRNLQEETKKGRFREDLYYRLNVVPLFIPPLRERKEDILSLALHFIQKFNDKHKQYKNFSPAALAQLETYAWPGNVRELQNIIERIIVTTDAPTIDVEHLPDLFIHKQYTPAILVTDIMPIQDAIELVEYQLLALAKKKYISTVNIAKVLKVNQSTISRKLKKAGL